MDSVESTKLFFEQEFERDLQNGEFYEIITKSSDEVNAVYLTALAVLPTVHELSVASFEFGS